MLISMVKQWLLTIFKTAISRRGENPIRKCHLLRGSARKNEEEALHQLTHRQEGKKLALAGQSTWLECCPDTPGFDPCSGHTQESTNGCISKWNNKLMSASLSLSFSLLLSYSLSLKSIRKEGRNPCQRPCVKFQQLGKHQKEIKDLEIAQQHELTPCSLVRDLT